MTHNRISLAYPQAVDFLYYLIDQKYPLEFDYSKNSVILYDTSDNEQLKYNYPLVLNINESIIKDKNLFNNSSQQKPLFLMMLVQAGHAALGLYGEGDLKQHKVIRKYMIRRKQGKSQLKYQKTKGKSRAGSRIRLANSVAFFEEINQYLNDWHNSEVETIIYSCSPMLWGMLFQSRILPPFKKKDKRLKKLPLSIDVPNFAILKKTLNFSHRGFIELMPGCSDNIKNRVLLFSGQKNN
jgi:Bacteroidetes VLRF1 release factor